MFLPYAVYIISHADLHHLQLSAFFLPFILWVDLKSAYSRLSLFCVLRYIVEVGTQSCKAAAILRYYCD